MWILLEIGDNCEMTCVGGHIGARPDRPGLAEGRSAASLSHKNRATSWHLKSARNMETKPKDVTGVELIHWRRIHVG